MRENQQNFVQKFGNYQKYGRNRLLSSSQSGSLENFSESGVLPSNPGGLAPVI